MRAEASQLMTRFKHRMIPIILVVVACTLLLLTGASTDRSGYLVAHATAGTMGPMALTTVTVSFAITGGGTDYLTPVFNYVQNGTSRQYIMTQSPTGLQADVGSAWSVLFNPLAGSTALERWYSSQSMSGTISAGQTLAFTFQHQYTLTVLVSPTGGGSVSPASGWRDAGAAVGISATADHGYVFQFWMGSGTGNYTGSNSTVSVTMLSALMETANFGGGGVLTAVTVSFSITGGGTGYTAPIFNYFQAGTIKRYNMTGTPTGLLADPGSAWYVEYNPLAGSTSLEKWYTSQALDGVISSGLSLVFSFQHQYMLVVLVSPTGGGSVLPAAGWWNAGASIGISAAPDPGCTFQLWYGTGVGNYTGANNPAAMTMGSAVIETAYFESSAEQVTMLASFTVLGGGTGYTAPIFNYVQNGTSKQQTLTGSLAEFHLDSGSAWSVSPNPLAGSTNSVRWFSSQPMNGTAIAQTIVFTFQHQFILTLQLSPTHAGSTVPITGWQVAGTTVQISASANPGYNFTSWIGSGTGSYSGTDNTASITMSEPIEETATFSGGPVPATMVVSFIVAGGGNGFSPPVFNCIADEQATQRTLGGTPTGVQCDSGTDWFVASNPLSGSTSSERWLSSQSMNGTASAQSIVFSFQHQFTLTMNASPSGGGLTAPATGWQNANSTVQLIATAGQGYAFQSWTGSGASSYSGASNPASIIMNGVIGETAIFVSTIVSLPSGACRFANAASLETPSTFYSSLRGSGLAPEQQILLPLSQILPASSLITNRRTRRGLLQRLAHGGGARGGLSGLTSVIVLVILIASAVIGMVAYYYSVSSGATQQPSLIFSDSAIKVNTSAGTGTVYIKMYNQGPGDVRIRSVNVASNSGNFGVDFSSGLYGMVSAPNCNCTISGGQSVGVGGSNGNGFIALPAGRTMAILVTFNAGMDAYFKPGTTYEATVIPVQAAEAHFNIPSQG